VTPGRIKERVLQIGEGTETSPPLPPEKIGTFPLKKFFQLRGALGSSHYGYQTKKKKRRLRRRKCSLRNQEKKTQTSQHPTTTNQWEVEIKGSGNTSF